MATNIKITALNDISANMSYNDLVAVVDMNGVPETKKANVQVFGNLILSSAGGSYFAKAAEATNAETVSNAAQPAITSVGTLTALTVTGNAVVGNINATLVSGTLTTAAQPNIISVGTLTGLTVSGNVTGQSYVSATTALQTTPVITSALPAAATAGAGARAMVTDADAGSVFGATLTGAGSLTLPVFSDGTIWRVG